MGIFSVYFCFDGAVVSSCEFDVQECNSSFRFLLHCECDAVCGHVDCLKEVVDVVCLDDKKYIVDVAIPQFYVSIVVD